MTTKRRIITAQDVTAEVLDAAEDICCGWWPEERIEWEDFIERLEKALDSDFGDSMLSPAISKIEKVIRAHRRSDHF